MPQKIEITAKNIKIEAESNNAATEKSIIRYCP